MPVKKDYTISDIYQGGFSTFNPRYGDVFTGYRISPSSLGLTTDPRTANVLQDASMKLNTGAKQIEISAVSPEVFESIPNQQLKEINRLAKLTGAEVSVHGPIVEPSGLTRDGFSETNREAVERQMLSAVERSYEMSPSGNVPVTFHSSVLLPGEIPAKGKEKEEALVIDTDSGSISRVQVGESWFPEEKGKKDINKELQRINERQWRNQLLQMEEYTSRGEDAVNRALPTALFSEAEKRAGRKLTLEEEEMRSLYGRGTNYLNFSYNNLKRLFDLAYSKGSDSDRESIDEFYKSIEQKAEKVKSNPGSSESVRLMKEIIDGGVVTLGRLPPPKIYQDLNEFSKQKAIETFSNLAFNSYKKFKDKSPVISIENPPAGGAFSTGQELKEIVEEARKKFVEKAKREGIEESRAREAADKLIGVTWDVGHINMLRKYGYEKGDIVKESEKVAKLVKHVHLSDNFGFEHTELPMGMGNVPVKEILDKLGKEGFDAKKIIEAGSWWQHFRTPPFKESLEAFGSSIYSMQMAPYWNQNLGFQQDYYPGYGAMLPQTNYETFGAGFSRLPMELGGQRPGAEGSRMSGRQME